MYVIRPRPTTDRLTEQPPTPAPHTQLCAAENLVLMADEVYQTNVYVDDRSFLSFRQARHTHVTTLLSMRLVMRAK